jgi:hypothetical protein
VLDLEGWKGITHGTNDSQPLSDTQFKETILYFCMIPVQDFEGGAEKYCNSHGFKCSLSRLNEDNGAVDVVKVSERTEKYIQNMLYIGAAPSKPE